MMGKKPKNKLLSIVIPTKNRYDVLFPTISNILKSFSGREDFEVIVQDNSDDNSLALTYLEKANENKIIYNHTDEYLSIVDNTEIALSFSTGEYVVFIGDDDLVSPYILDVLDVISIKKIEALIYRPAYYWWTSVSFLNEDYYHRPGAFWYPKKTNNKCTWIDTKKELKFVLEEGAVGLYSLPRLYHGIVRKEILEKIKNKNGKIVCGASPDMALAISLSLILEKHLKIDYPLTVYGSSKNSGGGWTAEKKHHGKLEDQQHLPEVTVKNWSDKLPRIWSEMTIYPQTVLEALESNSEYQINFTSFYAGMIVSEPYYFRILCKLIMRHIKNNPKEFLRLIEKLLIKLAGKIKRLMQINIIGMPYEVTVFENVSECTNYIKKNKPLINLQSQTINYE